MARLFAAGAVVIGCGFAGVQQARATTESVIIDPSDPLAAEAPPENVGVPALPWPDPVDPDGADLEEGPADDDVVTDPADEPAASPTSTPLPDVVEPDPTPTDDGPDPESSEPADSPETAETDDATDTGMEDDPATDASAPATSTPEPVPSPTGDADSAEPAESAAAEPAPADDVADQEPPIEASADDATEFVPEPSAAISEPAPVPAPPVDLEPFLDVRTEPTFTSDATYPTIHASTPLQPATAAPAPPASQTCQPEPAPAPGAPAADAGRVASPAIPPLNPWSPSMAWSTRETIGADADALAGPLSAIEHTTITGAGLAALMGQRVSSVSVAVDFARSSGGWAGPLVFNVWLRRQLRERRISQRQLGMLSGVNHSAISRLINGHASPTLETATKLVHALHMEWTDDQVATYFDLLPEHTLLPTQRVESALRGDGSLTDTEVRAIMQHYLMLRARRKRAGDAAGDPGREQAVIPDGAVSPEGFRPAASRARRAPPLGQPRTVTGDGSVADLRRR